MEDFDKGEEPARCRREDDLALVARGFLVEVKGEDDPGNGVSRGGTSCGERSELISISVRLYR